MSETRVNSGAHGNSYVLVTAAYNEERYIGKTLQAVLTQTVLPTKWIIVNDGSTDRTEEIVHTYAKRHSFIELYRVTEEHPRNLTAQVNAINKGFSQLKGTDYDFIGNLDADISFEPTYFERLLEKFKEDPHLALGGGFIYEERGGKFQNRRSNTASSVAHAVQMFRREGLETLGGYRAFTWAGADWHAEVSLRMKGWHVQAFPELRAFHHRPTGKGFGLLRYWYRIGLMDFYMGTHPVFEVFKIVRRFQEKPYVLGGVIRLSAFVWAYCSRKARQVPDEFVTFLRREQMERLRSRLLGIQRAP